MAIRPCPKCQVQAVRRLEEVSQYGRVWYFRCERCWHVWTVLKTDPYGPTHDVTMAEVAIED
jgi:hypothetical protein